MPAQFLSPFPFRLSPFSWGGYEGASRADVDLVRLSFCFGSANCIEADA